ncbi:MAG TPA: hypothetical protein VF713_19425, partial [Thermoanaerobaculia bacterium]
MTNRTGKLRRLSVSLLAGKFLIAGRTWQGAEYCVHKQLRREIMRYARRGVLAFFVYLTVFIAFPSFASTLRLSTASRGSGITSKSVHDLATVFFSGSFGYSIGGGQAIMKADTVTNPAATASGPLRFSLWFTS